MIKSAKKLSAAAIALGMLSAVSACMTATPYQAYEPELTAGVHGGFSEQRIAPDRYRVRFHGNELTSRDRVEGYMLYRAAELAVQNGYDWFTIIDRHAEHDVQTYAMPDPVYRPWYGAYYGYWRPHWRYYQPGMGWDTWHPEYGGPFWADRIDIRSMESFEAEAEIVFGKGPMPSGQPTVFDARRVLTDLGPNIVRPK